MECCLCLENFEDPRILPCSHTFCFECVKKLVENFTIQCPVCRVKHSVLNVNQVTKNLILAQLIEELKKRERNKKRRKNRKNKNPNKNPENVHNKIPKKHEKVSNIEPTLRVDPKAPFYQNSSNFSNSRNDFSVPMPRYNNYGSPEINVRPNPIIQNNSRNNIQNQEYRNMPRSSNFQNPRNSIHNNRENNN